MYTHFHLRAEGLTAAGAAANASSSTAVLSSTSSTTSSEILATVVSTIEHTTGVTQPAIASATPSFSPQMLSDASPEQTEKQIGQRNYIGIVVIAVLMAVALLLWLFFARSSRGIRRFCRRERQPPSTAGASPQVVTLTPAAPSLLSEPPSPTTPMDPKGASSVRLFGLGSDSGKLSPYATSDGGGSESVLDVEKGQTSETEHCNSSQVRFHCYRVCAWMEQQLNGMFL